MAPGSLRALLVGVALAACAAMTSPDRDGPRPRAKAPPPSPLTDAEPRLPEPEATSPTTPIRNLRVDPATMHVIWDVVGGAGAAGGGDKFLCRKGEHGPTLRVSDSGDPGGSAGGKQGGASHAAILLPQRTSLSHSRSSPCLTSLVHSRSSPCLSSPPSLTCGHPATTVTPPRNLVTPG